MDFGVHMLCLAIAVLVAYQHVLHILTPLLLS